MKKLFYLAITFFLSCTPLFAWNSLLEVINLKNYLTRFIQETKDECDDMERPNACFDTTEESFFIYFENTENEHKPQTIRIIISKNPKQREIGLEEVVKRLQKDKTLLVPIQTQMKRFRDSLLYKKREETNTLGQIGNLTKAILAMEPEEQ